MKTKVSICIDKETLKQVEEALREGIFRNKSHFIEYSIKQLLKKGRL